MLGPLYGRQLVKLIQDNELMNTEILVRIVDEADPTRHSVVTVDRIDLIFDKEYRDLQLVVTF